MYVTYQNTVCLPASALFEKGIIQSEGTYKSLRNRGHLKVLRTGFDKTKTFISVNTDQMRADIRQKVISIFGDPRNFTSLQLVNYIEWDMQAEEFFRNYRYGENKPLPEETIIEYTVTANILQGIKTLLNTDLANAKVTKGKIWENISKAVNNLDSATYPHRLPANDRRLQRKYKEYQTEGYKLLIHKNFGNEYTAKLNTESKEWILARWCNQVMRCANIAQLHAEYNMIAAQRGWKTVSEERTIYNYLYDEEVQPLWWAHRYGEKAADEKFGYQHTTELPTRRDALWYSDGTKMNFYYLEDGKIQTAWVYEVMDAFSEVLLGFHVSRESESFSHQYKAYKMAVQFSGHRPYEVKMDNQGGHKKLIASTMFERLSRLAIRTKPYNGKSKTIESAFGRFQQQIMKRCWFFTGQNVTAKKQESKANMEFILANKQNLPSFDEAVEIYKEMRAEWNKGKHFQTGLRKIDMYLNSSNEKAPKMTTWDYVHIFWMWHSQGDSRRAITFTPKGISFELNKQRFEYMVYCESGLPDQNFIDKSVDKKFFIKYDPEMMDEVYLYERDHSGDRFVAIAKPKITIHRAAQDQTEGENSFIKRVDEAKNAHRAERYSMMEEILENHGIAAWQQGFNTPKIKGAHKPKNNKKTTKTAETVEVDYDKQISSLTQNNIYDEF